MPSRTMPAPVSSRCTMGQRMSRPSSGRRFESKALRVAGLVVAIYAAAKAVVEATGIGGLMLRVGCYAAVGMFLLGAGYRYRNAGAAPLTSDRTPINSRG